MATLFLGSIGSSLGSALAGSSIATSLTTALGGGALAKGMISGVTNLVGAKMGGKLDTMLLNSKYTAKNKTQLQNIQIQAVSSDDTIPRIYGAIKVAGNIIWASKMTAYKKQHRRQNASHHYTISLAIAICEGPISEIKAVYADNMRIGMENIRTYLGTNDQMPDSLIEAEIGVENTPAYRGLAYVVIKDFDISAFGNKLPNFTFDLIGYQNFADSLENKIEAITMIPGSGEFVYDTIINTKTLGERIENDEVNIFIPQGKSAAINQNYKTGVADSIISLDHMQQTMPSLKWVSVVINWFATSTEIETCIIKPGVEFKDENCEIRPADWRVGKFTRKSAHTIGKNQDGEIRYGGTTNDASLLRYIKELKSRGYKVALYPMLLVDTGEKPWRGRINGQSSAVAEFFNKRNGYNEFIMHYAELGKNLVDAFIIGSEMVALNRIRSADGEYVAVNQFVHLASQAKNILGHETKITYAADWSEYHSAPSGDYHLDELWSSDNIDVVGIDAYFPLTNWSTMKYDIEAIKHGWESGEGYDFYYADEAKTIKVPLKPEHAWKNIEWWWKNEHFNANGQKTKWQPKSKKIWFTEYGFPSVNLATNQPNVFISQNSIESKLPHLSNGAMDIMSQRQGIEATESFWANSDMVEMKFLWCWDARPYPAWPSNKRWGDRTSWARGHWVQGKLGRSNLSAIVSDICLKANLTCEQFDSSKLNSSVIGFIIDQDATAKEVIQMLQEIYSFDVFDRDNKLCFVERKGKKIKHLNHKDFIVNSKEKIGPEIDAKRYSDLPSSVIVNYLNSEQNYEISSAMAKRVLHHNDKELELNLPVSMSKTDAEKIAHRMIYSAWSERFSYNFFIPILNSDLNPSDFLSFQDNGITHTARIRNISIGRNKMMNVQCLSENVEIYTNDDKLYASDPDDINAETVQSFQTAVEIIDIPFLKEQPGILIAASGIEQGWPGCKIMIEQPDGIESDVIINHGATIGKCMNSTYINSAAFLDTTSKIKVSLINGELYSIPEADLFINNHNLAVIGNEVIKFANAEQIEENVYIISHMLRGLYGTEHYVQDETVGKRFILLNDDVRELPHHAQTSATTSQLKMRIEPLGVYDDSAALSQTKIFQYSNNCIAPLSVASASCNTMQNSNPNDILVRWVPRKYNTMFLSDFYDEAEDLRTMSFRISMQDRDNKEIDYVDVIGDTKVRLSIMQNCNQIAVAQYRTIAGQSVAGPSVVCKL